MNLVLDIKNLNKSYDDFRLENINLKVSKGTIVGLIGENGAGKSTTIKSALNLVRKDSGDVRFFGEELTDGNKHLKNDIGTVFDSITFSGSLKVKSVENICKNTYKNWDSQKWTQYMRDFSINQNKMISELSKGMRLKVSLAIALCHDAKLLILDEPTSGLDPIIRDEILDIFLEFVQDENRAILLSSHITTDLEKIADYIVFIHEGKMVFSLPKDQIIYEYGIMRYTKDQHNKIDPKDIVAYRMETYQCSSLVSNKEQAVNKYADKLEGFVMDNATIDDVMLYYIRGEK